MIWPDVAEKEIRAVPWFVRKKAREAVEERVASQDRTLVTLEDVAAVREQAMERVLGARRRGRPQSSGGDPIDLAAFVGAAEVDADRASVVAPEFSVRVCGAAGGCPMAVGDVIAARDAMLEELHARDVAAVVRARRAGRSWRTIGSRCRSAAAPIRARSPRSPTSAWSLAKCRRSTSRSASAVEPVWTRAAKPLCIWTAIGFVGRGRSPREHSGARTRSLRGVRGVRTRLPHRRSGDRRVGLAGHGRRPSGPPPAACPRTRHVCRPRRRSGPVGAYRASGSRKDCPTSASAPCSTGCLRPNRQVSTMRRGVSRHEAVLHLLGRREPGVHHPQSLLEAVRRRLRAAGVDAPDQRRQPLHRLRELLRALPRPVPRPVRAGHRRPAAVARAAAHVHRRSRRLPAGRAGTPRRDHRHQRARGPAAQSARPWCTLPAPRCSWCPRTTASGSRPECGVRPRKRARSWVWSAPSPNRRVRWRRATTSRCCASSSGCTASAGRRSSSRAGTASSARRGSCRARPVATPTTWPTTWPVRRSRPT